MSETHRTTEAEYFARENAENLRKLAAEQKKKMAHDEAVALQKLHFMHCPKCGMELKTIKFRDIDIDRCFHCNGTFLDEAALSKLAGKVKEGVMASVLNIFAHPHHP
jgi:uncharacterized protein